MEQRALVKHLIEFTNGKWYDISVQCAFSKVDIKCCFM
jgi:hypothetical protein